MLVTLLFLFVLTMKSLQVGWLTPKIFVSAPGLLKMVHQVRFMMFSLKMVDYSMSFLSLST